MTKNPSEPGAAPAAGGIERRAIYSGEVRVEGEDESPVIVGHAAVFDQLSLDFGGFREKVAPGAFAQTLGGDIRALLNHNPDLVLGRTRAKTLRLAEDRTGLAVEITPPETEHGRAVVAAIRRGDITQMSFGFRTIEDQWDRNEETGESIRTLKRVELFDVSPVTFPAYPQTDLALRSLKAWRDREAANAPGGEGGDGAAAAGAAMALCRARTRQAEAEG